MAGGSSDSPCGATPHAQASFKSDFATPYTRSWGLFPYFWNLSWPRDVLYVLYMAEMTCVASKARPEASLQLLLSPSWDVSLRSLKRSNLLEDEGLQGEPKCPSGQSPTGRPVREAVTDHPAWQTL